MKPTIVGFFTLFIISSIYFSGCSSELDVSEYYHDLDSNAYLNKLDNVHFEIRQQLLRNLSKYLKTRASGESGDEMYRQLDWLIGLYNEATGIRDLSYRLSTYTAWDTTQAREVLSLRQSQAKLLRSRDSLSQPALRTQLEELSYHAERSGDSIYLAVITKDIAQVFETYNQIDSAINYYCHSISICRDLNYYSLMGNCQMLLGRIYNYRLADYLQSERAYGNAIKSFRKIDDKRFIPYVQLGRVYDFLQLYQTERAIGLINGILPQLKGRGELKNEAYCYYFLSVAYNNLGHSDSALYFGKRSADLRRDLAERNMTHFSDLGYSLSQLGLTYQHHGNDELALESFHFADSIFNMANDPAGAAVNLISWSNYLIEKKAYDSALAKLEDISDDSNFYENYICSRYAVAVCEYYQDSINQAINELKNCIWLVEHTNRKLPIPELKTGILSDKIGFYNLLSSIFINLFDSTGNESYADSAFLYLERSKSRALIDNLSGYADSAPDSLENRYLRKLAEIHKIGRASGEPKAAMHAIHDLEDSLLLLYIENSQTIDTQLENLSVTSINIETVQNELLDDNVILLEYLLSHFGNFVFIFSKGGFTIRKIDTDLDSLHSLIDVYLDAIDSYPTDDDQHDDYRQIGKILYSLLIPEKELGLYGAEKLFVVPSGPLHYLPLESLVDEQDNFLVERFDVAYIPSATTFQLIGHKIPTSATPSALAFASSPTYTISENVSMETGDSTDQPYWSLDDLAPLPSCSVEVQTIADCFHPNNIKIYIGDEATEANFKNTDYNRIDYLHIAAHGLTDNRHPSRSAIILSTSGDDDNDGLLRPREIIQMEIPIRMVFLSSCNSGRGKSFPGEGVLNLARPFLISGCNSAIVTYWNINDIATAKFVEYFYRNLINSQSHAQALATAKRQFIQSQRGQLRHPYFWAPFILIGS